MTGPTAELNSSFPGLRFNLRLWIVGVGLGLNQESRAFRTRLSRLVITTDNNQCTVVQVIATVQPPY